LPRLTLVDSDAERIASAKSAVPGPEYVLGDVLDVCRARRGKFDAIWLDYCHTPRRVRRTGCGTAES
jgi:hypothetical protein